MDDEKKPLTDSEKEEAFDRKAYYAKKNAETEVCPYNPAHIVKKRRFKRHCKGCPDNPARNPTYGAAYIKESINCPIAIWAPPSQPTLLPLLPDDYWNDSLDDTKESGPYSRCECYKIVLTKLGTAKINTLKQRVRTLYSHILEQYPAIVQPVASNVDKTLPDIVDDRHVDVKMPESWEYQSEKHTGQCLSVLSHLIEKKILRTDKCTQHILEAGAGSGMLSAYFSLMGRLPENKSIVYMIDRMKGLRKKYDRFCRWEGDETVRVPADLSDVYAPVLVEETEKRLGVEGDSIAVIGKHLCGSATDIAMRMAISCGHKLSGLGIALCCHAKGDGHCDCMTDFFASLGVTIQELTFIHKMCAWALTVDSTTPEDDRPTIGNMCRTLINTARIIWLQQQSNISSAGLVKYCSSTASPENVLMWAIGK